MSAGNSRSRISLLRTDRDGSVVIQGYGVRWSVASHRVAARGPPTGKARSSPRVEPKPAPGGRRINVNTATAAELEALPGVGPANARRIIEGRPYRSADDLERVKGIGPKRLEEIKPLVTVEWPPSILPARPIRRLDAKKIIRVLDSSP
jgi:competence protein ComEC